MKQISREKDDSSKNPNIFNEVRQYYKIAYPFLAKKPLLSDRQKRFFTCLRVTKRSKIKVKVRKSSASALFNKFLFTELIIAPTMLFLMIYRLRDMIYGFAV